MAHVPAPLNAPLTGALSTVPETAFAEPARAIRIRRWSLQVGRGGIFVSNITEQFGGPFMARTAERRPGFGLAAAAVAGGLALVLVGASAGRAWSPANVPSETAMLVPAATPFVPTAKSRAVAGRRAHRAAAAPAIAAETVPATPGVLSREAAIARAVSTGEFQEWTDRDGVTGFAVPGVAEVGAAGACRTLSILARRPDGTDQVTSSKVCAPVTAAD